MAYFLISLVSFVDLSLFSWFRENLVLNKYHNSYLIILCDFLDFLLV